MQQQWVKKRTYPQLAQIRFASEANQRRQKQTWPRLVFEGCQHGSNEKRCHRELAQTGFERGSTQSGTKVYYPQLGRDGVCNRFQPEAIETDLAQSVQTASQNNFCWDGTYFLIFFLALQISVEIDEMERLIPNSPR